MQKKQVIIFSPILLITIALISLYSCNNQFSQNIPALPELDNETPELKEQIENTDKQARKKPSGENLGMLGMVYYASNYYDLAAKCFELAIQREPEAWQWRYYLGSLHMELGESSKAIAEMKEVIQLEPKAWIAWYRLGDIYQQLDSVKLAEERLNKIIQLTDKDTYLNSNYRSTYFPLQLYAGLIRSKIYQATDRYDTAEKDLKDICNSYMTFGPAFRQLGSLYVQKGEMDLGKRYQERANDLRVFNFPVDTLMDKLSLMSRSEAYVLKQIDNAVQGRDSKWSYELIKHAHKNIPNSKYVLSKAIRQYCSIGLGKQALPLLDQHFDLFNDSYDEMLQIGIRLSNAGYRKEASKYFEHALSFEDQTPEQKATLAGMFLENAGMAKRAVELMSEVVEQNIDNTVVLGDAVFLMLQTNQSDKAFKYFNLLKELSPKDAKVKIFEGIQAEKAGKTLSAISLFEEAYDDNPKDKFLKKRLPELYFKEQLWSKAIPFFRKALQTHPNDSELQMYIGLLLVTCPDESLRDLNEGKEYSERAFYNSRYTLNNRISAGRTLSLAHHQLGNKERAESYINQTIEMATKAKVSESYVRELRRLAQQFSQ